MVNKVLLIILDGWGLSSDKKGNAPFLAKTPTLDYLYSSYPKTSLSASGLEVGLSPGEPGNSEVGHMNIGSGRVVWENLPRIDQSIESGQFAGNEILKKTFSGVKRNNSTLHLIGIVSDGGVHGHIRHLLYLLDIAAKDGIKNIAVHFISDGRDTPSEKAGQFLTELESKMKSIGVGCVATVIGRYFAMDRDNNWERSKKAFELFTQNSGTRFATAKEAFDANYKNGKSDEFIEPSVIGEGATIQPKDGVILFNYRSDRMTQLMHLFSGEEKSELSPDVDVISVVEYEKNQRIPSMFPPINLDKTVSDLVAEKGLSQVHAAETEKYAHVTYFFKAGKKEALSGESDEMVPSKKNSYDKIPEMSAYGVSAVVEKSLGTGADFIVMNFANGDMVGHTGVLDAAVLACEAVDKCLSGILPIASEKGYKVLITADHGNCEKMIDGSTGQPDKEHTGNPVPLIFIDFLKRPYNCAPTNFKDAGYAAYASGTPIGVLADLAPSILANLEINKPEEMSGMDLTAAMQQ